MSETFPAVMFEKLSNAIGDRFSFDDLDLVLYKCAGERIINDIANRLEPTREMARKCLLAVEKAGTSKTFLYLILEARRADAELCEMIIGVAPELAEARAETKENVTVLVSQLYKTKDNLREPLFKAAISNFREMIQNIYRDVEILAIYKNLHDNLHQIKLKRVSDLRDAAVAMKTDRSQIEKLRDFQDQARTSHALARPWVGRLSDEATAQAIEKIWVDKLEDATDRLQTAIDDLDVPAVRLALAVIWRIIEVEPSRLNGQIFTAARKLPLHELVRALTEVGEVTEDDGAGIVQACAAIRDLSATLLGRAVDHDLWQEVDDRLWVIDKTFLHSAGNPIDDFVIDWPQTESLVLTLSKSDPESSWSIKLTRYANRIDDELLRIESGAGGNSPGTEADAAKNNLHSCYDAFCREARFRFFLVDQSLKRDCAALVEIGAPLKSILKELGDG